MSGEPFVVMPSGGESMKNNPNANSKSSSARNAKVSRAGKKGARTIGRTGAQSGKTGSGYRH